ncbi:hypothetical protein CWI37_0102p0020 [Hamiltosporidium tvaerminnensis]|uniref:Uncharacterized protein n=1 Tax=Hamiltosporidium tvaerminnensis TaxID=1176355 RepID=A0A4Q9LB05_9MICR|nr:hypothetical protein CWI37_0102p0020 [Hamiltosporidium tvaerminnensis]
MELEDLNSKKSEVSDILYFIYLYKNICVCVYAFVCLNTVNKGCMLKVVNNIQVFLRRGFTVPRISTVSADRPFKIVSLLRFALERQ